MFVAMLLVLGLGKVCGCVFVVALDVDVVAIVVFVDE